VRVCAHACVCVCAWPGLTPCPSSGQPCKSTHSCVVESVLWQRSNGSALGALDPPQPPPLVIARHDARSHTATTPLSALARAVHEAGVLGWRSSVRSFTRSRNDPSARTPVHLYSNHAWGKTRASLRPQGPPLFCNLPAHTLVRTDREYWPSAMATRTW